MKTEYLRFAMRFSPLVPLGVLIYFGMMPDTPERWLWEITYCFAWCVIIGNPWSVLSHWLSPLSRLVLASGMVIAYVGYKVPQLTELVRAILLALGLGCVIISVGKRREWMAVFAIHQSWRVDEVINVFAYGAEISAVEHWEAKGCGELRAVLRQNLHVNLSEESLTYSHKAAYLLGRLSNEQEAAAAWEWAQEEVQKAQQNALDAAKAAVREKDYAVEKMRREYSKLPQQLRQLQDETRILHEKLSAYENPLSSAYEEAMRSSKSTEEIMREKGWIRAASVPAVEIPTAEDWTRFVNGWSGSEVPAAPAPVLELVQEPEQEETREERDARILEMIEGGASLAEAAEAFGLSRSGIQHALRRARSVSAG